ncbi:hypothetical protein [Agrilutibacter solisilvae]|uniref:Uncharacterized protein n=1 Tax=Agrilutibacter solisilvae TaxID=2763317 RepID=A0A974Y0L6_9GAMM|nr:hypothetical protein [Lysobacter solisilvae]QSX79109.1 hypothetical protein I8J32_004185 [Lysobacter solisilvae]
MAPRRGPSMRPGREHRPQHHWPASELLPPSRRTTSPHPHSGVARAALDDVLTRRLHSSQLRNDPRHAAGAVLIGEHLSWMPAVSTGVQPRPVNTRQLAQALARSPDDVPLAWLYAYHCHAPDCASQQAWAHVLAREPDNLAAWMLMPYDKAQPPDEEGLEAWLAQSARATYVDGHFGDFARAMAEAIGPLPALPVCKEVVAQMETQAGRAPRMQDLATMTAHGQSMAYLPTLRRLFDACPRDKPLTHRRLSRCQQVMRILAASNDMIYASMGTGWLEQRALTAAERARWAEHMRNLRWAMDSGARNLRPEHLPLVWEQGELAVVIAILEDRGQWPAPPGWKPTERY